MELSIKQGNVIQFRLQKSPLIKQYKCKNTKLKIESTATLLGIKLDSTINRKSCVQNLSSKLSTLIYAFFNLKMLQILKLFYLRTMPLSSKLSHGTVLWEPTLNIF